MAEVTYGSARGKQDLEGILRVQQANLRTAIEPSEAQKQGFVTVRHTLDVLEAMNDAQGHVVARQKNKVIGYALSMLPSFRHCIDALKPMCARLEALRYQGRPLGYYRYFIMGQICVAKPRRGQGVFVGLYQTMRALYAARYDLVVTEISSDNLRSARAHANVGFAPLHRYNHGERDTWDIVAWAWGRAGAPGASRGPSTRF